MNKLERLSKRKHIEANDKKLIALQRRMWKLYEQQRELPLIELEKPIQRGFKKFFVLRDDIARRRDAKDFERILSVINRTIYSRKEDFKVKKYHNNQTEDIPHVIGHVPEYKWDDLGWPEHFKKWFSLTTRHHNGKYGSMYSIKAYYFTHDYMFVTKTAPYFITHVRQVDSNLERELKEIKQYFKKTNGWSRLQHLHGTSEPKDKYTISDTIGEQLLREQMQEFEENYLDCPT